MAKKKKSKFKIIMICVFIVLILALGFCISDIIKVLNNDTNEVEVLSEIKDYGYSLNENDSEYFKEKFMLLKTELEKDNIDEEKYASLISELFAIDFYSLDNSINRNDVGGIQFIYTDFQNDFKKLAKNSIYKIVENNIYGNRKQELPKVKETEVKSIEQENLSYDNVKDSKGYVVKILITYEQDLEYPEEITINIVHNNSKLEIAEVE